MQQKGWLILRILLNRYHEGAPETALKTLAPDDVKMIVNQNVLAKDPQSLLADPDELLKRIHYSWLIPELEKLPKKLIPAQPVP